MNIMRKIITIFITILFAMAMYADDACYSVYLNALRAYNSGDYIEAQRKFILVAQTCGDYQEVYKKLRDCNTKLKEKQTASANEISTLKENNRKLTEQYNAKKSEYSDLQRQSATRIAGLEKIIEKDSIRLDSVNNVLNATKTELNGTRNRIQRLERDSAFLRYELDSMTHIKDSLQNKLEWWKIKRDTVTDDDKKLNEETLTKSQKDKDKDKGSEKSHKKKNPTPAKQEEPSEVEHKKNN